MMRRLLATLSVTALAFALAVRADAQRLKKIEPRKPAVPAVDSGDPQVRIKDAGVQQERLKQQFEDFREALRNVAQRLKDSDKPEEHEKGLVLMAAIKKASEQGTDGKFVTLVRELRKNNLLEDTDNLDRILSQNKDLRDDLRKILEYLLKDNRDEELRRERERITELLERLKDLIRKQEQHQAQVEGRRQKADDLRKSEEKIKNETARLLDPKGSKNGEARKAEGKDGGKKGKEGRGEGKDDTKDPKAGDKDREGKNGQGKEGKPGEGKDGNTKEGKNGEGKDNKNGKEGKPGEGKEGKPGQGKEGKPGEGKDNKNGKPGEGKEGKPGEGKEGKPGQGKEGKPGEGKEGKPGQGKEGKPGSGKEGKPGEGKPGQGKEGKPGEGKDNKNGKPGEGKPGSGKPGEGKKELPGNAKQGGSKEAGKPGSGKYPIAKTSTSKASSSKSGNGKPSPKSGSDSKGRGEGKASPKGGSKSGGKSGQQSGGKPGQSKSGGKSGQSGQSGQQQAGQSKSGGSSGSKSGGQQKEQDKMPGREKVAEAGKYQQKSIDELKKPNNDAAAEDEGKAAEKLKEAQKKLEELLRQIRQEEMERLLAALQARCNYMLTEQLRINKGTVEVDQTIQKNPGKQPTRAEEQEGVRLSEKEEELVREAAAALRIIEADGTAVAFAEVFKQLQGDMANVAGRLRKTDTGTVTQTIEKDIVATLEEMIQALKKAVADNKKKGQKKGGGGGGGGGKQDQKLIDDIAELKMIRSMQLRVNRRTEVYGKQFPGEQVPAPEKATTPREKEQLQTIQRELKDLGTRQDKIAKITRDIATGKNEAK